MKCYSRYLICVASLLFAAVLPASAGSVSGSYTSAVIGIGVTGETVTATFTFNTSSDQFTNVTLAFKGGVFGGFTESYSGCGTGLSCSFSDPASGDSLLYTIGLNNNFSQYGAVGTVWNTKSLGGFGYTGSPSVPEGGSKFSYLAPAGLVIFGGIFLSGFVRPRIDRQENVRSNR
jgi:hypothetical protein